MRPFTHRAFLALRAVHLFARASCEWLVSDKRNSLSRWDPYGMLRHERASMPVRNDNPTLLTL